MYPLPKNKKLDFILGRVITKILVSEGDYVAFSTDKPNVYMGSMVHVGILEHGVSALSGSRKGKDLLLSKIGRTITGYRVEEDVNVTVELDDNSLIIFYVIDDAYECFEISCCDGNGLIV